MSNPDFTRMNKSQIAAWAAERGGVIKTTLTKDQMVVEAEQLARQGIAAPAPADDPEDRNAAPEADAAALAAPPIAPAQPSATVSVLVTAYHVSRGPTVFLNRQRQHFPLNEWVHDVPRAFVSALQEIGTVTFETKE